MIYSGSGCEFLEFQIQILPKYQCYLTYLEIILKKLKNSIKKKNLQTVSHFLFHTTVLQYIVQNSQA